MRQTGSARIKSGSDLSVNSDSFVQHIRAENLGHQTFVA